MSLSIIAVSCPSNDWTEVHDGSGAADLQLKITNGNSVALARDVAGVKPSADWGAFDTWCDLDVGNSSVAIKLADGEKLYARDRVLDGYLRGFKSVD